VEERKITGISDAYAGYGFCCMKLHYLMMQSLGAGMIHPPSVLSCVFLFFPDSQVPIFINHDHDSSAIFLA